MPHHSTLSRRRKRLDIEPTEPSSNRTTDIVTDATGLKMYGVGEWCAEKHGRSKRRWRKLSISLDPKSGDIVAHYLTDSDIGDPERVETLLDAGERPVRRFFADGAFDGEPVYRTVRRYQSDGETAIVIPPRQTAILSGNRDGPTERDCHIERIRQHGRMAWQKTTNYGRRSLVETAIGRYKAIIGGRLRARSDDAQITEVAIGVKVLNRMMHLANPVSVRVGSVLHTGEKPSVQSSLHHVQHVTLLLFDGQGKRRKSVARPNSSATLERAFRRHLERELSS